MNTMCPHCENRRARGARHPVPGLLLLVALCVCVFRAAGQQPANYDSTLRQSPELVETVTSEIISHAQRLVSGKKYGEAVPFLNELAYRYRFGEENRKQRQLLEWAYFYLGLGLVELGQFDRAADIFGEYAKRFPKGTYVRSAVIIWADCLCSSEEWSEAQRVLTKLIRTYKLSAREHVTARRLLGEALIKQEKWDEALKPLQYVFKRSIDAGLRSKAAVLITTCYVRLDRMEDLYRFLPEVQRASPSARYDIEFNFAMIEAGDRNFYKQNYVGALVCYRQVHFKPELIGHCDRETTRLQARKRELLRRGMVRPEQFSELSREITAMTHEKERLAEVEEYDQQIIIRQARAYLELKRHWEALVLFRSVFERFPKHELADQALYSAFAVAAEMDEEEQAVRAGKRYLAAFPEGEFFDEITLMMAQLHVKKENYTEAVAIIEEALTKKKDHMYYEEMCYLEGYSLFQLEDFKRTLEVFAVLRERTPDGEYREAADYWHAMAQLYNKNYQMARDEFAEFTLRYLEGNYFEDASFRLGVAQYAMGEYEEAGETLRGFTERFPLSELKAEAFAMLGDIHAGQGDLDVAIDYFGKVWDCTDNIIYIDYATHRAAKVYELESRYEEMIQHYTRYLSRFGHRGRFTEAVYWVGFARMRLGRTAEAIEGFLSAVQTYGNKPTNFGVDMILRDLVDHTRHAMTAKERAAFIEKLGEQVDATLSSGQTTLHLRLLAALIELTDDTEVRNRMVVPILDDAAVSNAAPYTLLVIADESRARGNTKLARAAYDLMLARYRKSDLVLEALKQAGDLGVTEGRYAEALPLLEEVVQRFATMPAAGWAQKRIGDLYRLKGDYAQAVAAYNAVLGVKEWKGPLWPESLYQIGLCRMSEKKIREACAFFERIYLLYGAYPEWAARAYIRRAECLKSLNRRLDAITMYEQLLSDKALAQLPEAATARRELARLKP